MNKRLTTTLETISRQIPLDFYPRLIPRDLIDFFWHAISDQPMPHVRHLYPVVPVANFEDALLYLKHNYTFISYPELHAHIFEGTQLPPKAVHISFDDGYAECFSVVRPLLLKHSIPCTFFLTTSLLDNHILFYRNKQSLCVERLIEPPYHYNPSTFNLLNLPPYKIPSTLPEFIAWFKDLRLPDEALIDEICRILAVDWQRFLSEEQPYLTTEQVQQMHSEGFTMGAHTLTHRKLVDLPEREIDTEIIQSCQIVGEITAQQIIPFSFPHSAWGLDRHHLAQVRTRDPKIGVLFDTKGLRRDTTFIHNRVWAERSLPTQPQRRSQDEKISHHLHKAYQEAWVEHTLAAARRLRKRTNNPQ